MDQFEFVDSPPPPKPGGRKAAAETIALADALRARPGEWVKVSGANTQLADTVKNGKSAFSPAGAFEATTRNQDRHGKGDVYVRFVEGV